ncbi:HesA/MoeB/ThiF family protein [Frankia sp. Cr2]|uniref:HesA/MoeB/ThiF family protein n=1 Tax=Frankia sp. Cr2 TaxID=3073932 RepID=UPI002AD2DA1D|nr:ThiF family adenylyltransferase [Frankia sp. Cr2]
MTRGRPEPARDDRDERDERDERYDRQIRAFGADTQHQLSRLTVGVVGVGGAGSLVVQGLAHLGVGRLLLVDPDRVETSNLARLVGATPADARQATPKVDVASRLARAINPDLAVTPIRGSILDPTAGHALSRADILIGAVDGHAPRWAINRLAVQYGRLYLDIGVELSRSGSGADLEVGGRVAVVRPDGPCLRCQDGYDPVLAAREQDPLTRAARRAAGYESGGRAMPAVSAVSTSTPAGASPGPAGASPGPAGSSPGPAGSSPGPAASVLFLNQAVVALALGELVNSLTPWRATAQQILLDLVQPRLTNLSADSDPICPVCGPDGIRGSGTMGHHRRRPQHQGAHQRR